ncbi:MAG: trypsin-like peptidase domain-containing protein [Methylovirgula sp.]
MITISHLSGPLAGKSQSFDDTKDKIEFGRESDCDVVYPADEETIGRRHCALVRQLSDWELHIHEGSHGLHFVSVNGTPVGADQPVDPNSVFHLGRKDGPSFEVKFDQAGLTPNIGATGREDKYVPPTTQLRHVRIVGAIVAVLIVGVLGFWYRAYDAQQKQVAATIASLTEDEAKAKQALADSQKAAAASISQSIIDKVWNATFLVILQDAQGRKTALGTAWAIGPNVLATNAHIAGICDDKFPVADRKIAECDDLKPGDKLLVLQSGTGHTPYEVVGHSFHPGYIDFPKLVFGQDPAFVASIYNGTPSQISGYGYDVGLLTIKETLPADLALQFASKDEILALKPGMPVASAGFPYENVSGDQVLTLAATPQVHYGNITALTDFLFLQTDPAHRYLVQHSVPETGGGSGSPIVAASGHIVAINNAGTFGPKGEWSYRGAPSGVEINYAQRVDIVDDIFAGRAAAAFEADKPYWTTQMANFKRGIDVIGAWVLDKAKPDAKSTAQLVSTTPGQLTTGDMRIDSTTKKNERIKVQTLNLQAGVSYFIFVYADKETPIAVYLKDANNRTLVSNTDSQWYPGLSFKPTASGPLSLMIVGPDRDTTYTTKVYSWQQSNS